VGVVIYGSELQLPTLHPEAVYPRYGSPPFGISISVKLKGADDPGFFLQLGKVGREGVMVQKAIETRLNTGATSIKESYQP